MQAVSKELGAPRPGGARPGGVTSSQLDCGQKNSKAFAPCAFCRSLANGEDLNTRGPETGGPASAPANHRATGCKKLRQRADIGKTLCVKQPHRGSTYPKSVSPHRASETYLASAPLGLQVSGT